MTATATIISAIGGLLVLLALAGTAWAVVLSATIKANLEAEEKRSGRLEAEIEDADRREARLKLRAAEMVTEIGALKDGWGVCQERLTVVEEILQNKVEDIEARRVSREILEGMAALKGAVDSTVTATLKRIEEKVDKWNLEDAEKRIP